MLCFTYATWLVWRICFINIKNVNYYTYKKQQMLWSTYNVVVVVYG